VAIGKYDITSGRTRSGIPYVNAVATQVGAPGAEARAAMARTPEIIEWEIGVFGRYPFESVGGVVPDATFNFALENQTRPVYSPGFWRNGPADWVVVHELAHQWFGDSVSVDRWQDIWLNEGFASVAEWLYAEHTGERSAQASFDQTYASYPADHPMWRTVVADPGTADLFREAVYDRGAMTLHALRNVVGDRVFFTTLRHWAEAQRYGNGRIEEFVALAQKESGRDLHRFFHVWLYTPGKPAPTVENGFPPVAAVPAPAPAPAHPAPAHPAPAPPGPGPTRRNSEFPPKQCVVVTVSADTHCLGGA
jgi:aminopeptidase N